MSDYDVSANDLFGLNSNVENLKTAIDSIFSELSRTAPPSENIRLAGVRDIVIAKPGGAIMAGSKGILIIQYWDELNHRMRCNIAYVGENGIKPDTYYCLNDNHDFVEIR